MSWHDAPLCAPLGTHMGPPFSVPSESDISMCSLWICCSLHVALVLSLIYSLGAEHVSAAQSRISQRCISALRLWAWLALFECYSIDTGWYGSRSAFIPDDSEYDDPQSNGDKHGWSSVSDVSSSDADARCARLLPCGAMRWTFNTTLVCS